jgi:hypothetical protein
VIAVYHYTDEDGWNAIRSQKTWRFIASQPRAEDRPFGAYFTDVAPTVESPRTLHKRLRIPKVKQEYVFCFHEVDGLIQHRDGRGRDQHIYYSPKDDDVVAERQVFAGPSASALKEDGR